MTKFDSYIGHVFDDRYTVLNVIGHGENAVVFGAYDKETGKTVALKMLHSRSAADTKPRKYARYNRYDKNQNARDEELDRFYNEIASLSVVSHPNIVQLYDVHTASEPKYFVMEYIEGITLKRHILDKSALSDDEIIFLSRQILSALSEIHKKNIVHCDIKPQNIVIVGSGDTKLMDFGISKPEGQEVDESSEFALGTVHYVSPEQAEGRPLYRSSDLYSFGVMLYEMATGVLPFFGYEGQKIAELHVSTPPVPPSQLNPSVSPELESIILKSMEKDPVDRYLSADEFLKAINAFAKSKGRPKSDTEKKTVAERLVEFFKKRSVVSCLTGVLCALLVSVVVGLGFLGRSIVLERSDHHYVKIPNLRGVTFVSLGELGLDTDKYDITVKYSDFGKVEGAIKNQTKTHAVVRVSEGDRAEFSITVVKRTLPKIMPDLKYLPVDQVTSVLEAYKCRVRIIETEHDFLPSGYVYSTSPAAGEASEKKITLYVSK